MTVSGVYRSAVSLAVRGLLSIGEGPGGAAPGVISAILNISGIKGLIHDAAGGALVNSRSSTATVVDNLGLVRNSPAGDIRHKGARLFESYFVNTDSPITTKINNIGAGDYILSATGTGTVVISGGPSDTLTVTANRKQLLFTVANDTVDVTFTVAGVLTNWQLEKDYSGIASEYLPCNLDQSDGLAFAVRTEAGAPFSVNINVTLSSGSSAWITDDGTTYTTEDLSHTFGNPVNAFKWYGEPGDLTQLYCYSNQLTGSIPNLDNNVALTTLYCYSNQLTGSIPNLDNNVALTQLHCYSNQLTGSIPSLDNNSALSVLHCYANQLTGSIPNLDNNSALSVLRCFSNQLTGYITAAIPITLLDFRAENNLLTESAVNQLLIDFDTAGHSGGVLNIGGAGNAAPTGAGLTAKANLQGKSWTVTTN